MRYHYEKPTNYSTVYGTTYICDHPVIEFFNNRSGKCVKGLYPTVSIHQIMWALKLKSIPRELWETCFNKKSI